MRQRSGSGIVVGFLALAALVTAPVHGQETPVVPDGRPARLVGAWRVLVSPDLPGNPVFVNLSAIHLDGTLVGFPPASPLPDGTVTSGSTGVWRPATLNEFDVVF
jgi:hypothetical protein